LTYIITLMGGERTISRAHANPAAPIFFAASACQMAGGVRMGCLWCVGGLREEIERTGS
jgi:hypothetical protein